MDLTKYRIFHPRPPKYTFFSSTHGTFSSRDHMLGHKASLNKFKNVEIMSIFSVHSGIKLEVNSRRKMGKVTHMWKLNKMHLHNQGGSNLGSNKKSETALRCMEMKTQLTVYRIHRLVGLISDLSFT